MHHGVCFISLFQLFVLFSPYSILLLVTLPENSFVTRMLFLSQRFGWGSLLLLPVPYLLRLYSLLPKESGEPREHSDCCTAVYMTSFEVLSKHFQIATDEVVIEGTSCSKLQILPYSVIWRFIGRVTCQDMDPLDSSPLCDSPLVWNMCEWSGDTHSYRRPPAVQSCMCGFTQAVVLLGLKCFLLSLTSLSPPCSLCMSVPLLQKFVLFSFPPHRCVWQNENKSLVASGPFLEVARELCRMWL